MIFGRGERIASLEARIEGVHQDIHMLSEQVAGVSRSIETLRKDFTDSATRRVSWGVASVLTLTTGITLALIGAVASAVLR